MSATHLTLLGTAAVLAFWMIGAHNRLIKLRNKMRGHFTELDAQLSQRHALAQTLAEAAGAHAGVDSEAMQAVAAASRQADASLALARAHPSEMGPLLSLAMAEQLLDANLTRLVGAVAASLSAHAPSSPDPANRWGELSAELERTHSQITFTRQLFNTAVARYNEAVAQRPTCWLTGVFRLHPSAPLLPEPSVSTTSGPSPSP